MMIALVGMIVCCASEALVLVMIVVIIVVKSMIRWSMSGGRHIERTDGLRCRYGGAHYFILDKRPWESRKIRYSNDKRPVRLDINDPIA